MRRDRLNRSGQWGPAPSRDWGLICGIVLAMLGLVGMLVFLTQKLWERHHGWNHWGRVASSYGTGSKSD